LWDAVPRDVEWIVISEPRHLIYFANFVPSPFVFNSQGAAGALIVGRDDSSILVADNVQEPFLEKAFVTEKVAPLWYRCVESAAHRADVLIAATRERLQKCRGDSMGYEATACPAALFEGLQSTRPEVRLTNVDSAIARMRRQKDPDEVAAIKQALAAATAALVAAISEVRPGISEFDVYRLVQRVAGEAAGCHILVYGDFVSGPRCEKGGGPPSERVIQAGDLVLLDFSVVIDGYRGDFCNTFVCAGRATPRQRELFDACFTAMQAGERQLRPGVPCRDVHLTVRDQFAQRRLAEYFPHHAGHGVGLGHPEPPFIVPESSETLAAGDVVTLEPGVYLPGETGMRYERNYLITGDGYELLSDHPIRIDAR
jgi:Xaa-Pro aminopeptidase